MLKTGVDEEGRSLLGVRVPAALVHSGGSASCPAACPWQCPPRPQAGDRLEAGRDSSRHQAQVRFHRSSQGPGVSAMGAPTNPARRRACIACSRVWSPVGQASLSLLQGGN